MFRDVVVGWLGSVGYNRVFTNSNLGRDHAAWLASFPVRSVSTGEGRVEEIPMFLLGDSAYANTRFMVTTYEMNQINQSAKVRQCDQALSAVRYQVEQAFGILKGRFRLLTKSIYQNFDFVAKFVFAICFIHNFLIAERDHLLQSDTIRDDDVDHGEIGSRVQERSRMLMRRVIEGYLQFSSRSSPTTPY